MIWTPPRGNRSTVQFPTLATRPRCSSPLPGTSAAFELWRARYGADVWIHPAGRARLGEVPELAELPTGIEPFVPAGADEGQVAFHILPERTLVVAEFFLGIGGGLRVAPSPATRDPVAFAASLDQLRNLSIERVLVAHGQPVLTGGENAIALALDAFAPDGNR